MMTGRFYNIALVWCATAFLMSGFLDARTPRRRRRADADAPTEQVAPKEQIVSNFSSPIHINVPKSVTDAMLDQSDIMKAAGVAIPVAATPSSPGDSVGRVLSVNQADTKGEQAERKAVESTEQTSLASTTSLNVPVNDPLRTQLLHEEAWGSEKIELNFKDADLVNVLQYMEKLFKVTFITSDVIKPLPQGMVGASGHKLTFTTHVPFSRRQVWDTLIVFLGLSGLTAVRVDENIYRVIAMANVNQAPLPSFVGVSPDLLPDNDMIVRYVYFLENIGIDEVFNIMGSMASPTAIVKKLDDLNAIFISDKAANIKSLMKVVSELDRDMPEAMSVLRLQHASASKVKALYDELTKAEDPKGLAKLMGAKKQPSSFYFPVDTRMIVEPRTNSLVLLGTKSAIERVEKFIIEFADGVFDIPEFPLYVHELQYANANTVANILQQVTAFSPSSSAAQYGTVVNGQKFFKQPISITPEPFGNRLVIRCDRDDYPHIHTLIKQLDVKQPQVGIEVLIVDVSVENQTALGAQLRNKTPTSLGDMNFQNSGFPVGTAGSSPPIVNATTGSLVTSLIGLASSNLQTAGTALLTIGNELTSGVWAIFKILRSCTQTNVLSNPFLVTTNKYKATVSIGEIRRVVTGEVQGATSTTNAMGDRPAKLTLGVTPQISSDGIIQLNVQLTISEFTDANPTNATMSTKIINTLANVGDNQVLALGGFIKSRRTDIETKLPFLGDIPLIGWLFKNRQKHESTSHLLVFIAPRRMDMCKNNIDEFTRRKAEYSADILDYESENKTRLKDPFNRWLFKEHTDKMSKEISNFMAQKSFACSGTAADSDERDGVEAWCGHRKPTRFCGCCSEIDSRGPRPEGHDQEDAVPGVHVPLAAAPVVQVSQQAPAHVKAPERDGVKAAEIASCAGGACSVSADQPPATVVEPSATTKKKRSSVSQFFGEAEA